MSEFKIGDYVEDTGSNKDYWVWGQVIEKPPGVDYRSVFVRVLGPPEKVKEWEERNDGWCHAEAHDWKLTTLRPLAPLIEDAVEYLEAITGVEK